MKLSTKPSVDRRPRPTMSDNMLDLDELRKHVVALEKGDDNSQRQALHSLRHLDQQEWVAAPQAVVHSLVASLQQQLSGDGKRPLMQKEIATILGNMSPRSKSAVPQLIRLLQEGVPDPVRESAATALGKLGSDARAAVGPLLALADSPPALALHAVRALGGIGCDDQRVRAALVKLWLSSLQSQHGQIQTALALCKLKIDAKGLHAYLTHNLVAGQEESLRKSAAEALGWCGKNDLDVVPALLTATLADKSDDVKAKAQAALDQMRLSHEQAIRVCAKQLKDSALAETALRKSGALAVPVLVDAVSKEEPATRVKAARILGALGELAAQAVPALTAALRERDPEIRLAAAKSLWNISKNADAVVPVLIHLLEEKRPVDPEDGEARRRFLQTVIEALWRIGPPAKAAVPALMERSKDKTRLISESAVNALKKIGGPG